MFQGVGKLNWFSACMQPICIPAFAVFLTRQITKSCTTSWWRNRRRSYNR